MRRTTSSSSPVELGVPGAICLSLFLAFALRQQWRLLRHRRPKTFTALPLAVDPGDAGAQPVDFNLYIPANALVFLLALTVPFALTAAGDRARPPAA